jgi:hypothetical protein
MHVCFPLTRCAWQSFLTAGLLFSIGCHTERQPTPEVILAIASGDLPFSDSIILVPPDGASTRTLFSPSSERSYSGVSAVSMTKPMVIQVNELKNGVVNQSLLDYDPETGKLNSCCWDVGAKKGMGTISPDGQTYAFPDFPSTQAGITFVRCDQKGAPVISHFQDAEIQGDQSWYISLAWGATGGELAAVKVWRGKGIRGLRTELQLIDTATKTQRTLLAPEDVVVAASVAADGRIAILDTNGVEILLPATGERRVVLPKASLNGRRYLSGGMLWLKHSESVVLSLLAPTETVGELWMIAVHDGSVRVINRMNGFRFSSICSASTNG